jgi:hypothetical protein
VIIEARDLAGNAASKSLSVTLDTIPPAFNALRPQSGLITNQRAVAVSGTLSEDALLAINGTAVAVAADRTFAALVDLTEGTNSISLRATDRAGNVAAKSLIVTRDTFAPTLVSLTPASGSTVSGASLRISGTFDDATEVSLSGMGLSRSSLGNAFGFDVTLAIGANVFTLRGTDAAGNISEQQIVISRAADYDPVDAPYLSVWDGMNAALLAGDIETAVININVASRNRYRAVFEALLPNMQGIIESYSRPAAMYASENYVEYAIGRQTGTSTHIFIVSFSKQEDGTWKIESM